MKFALVNNERCDAMPKTKGICPVCGAPVIAKCGEQKVHHWAHETRKDCPNERWENEGEWHQSWKNKFPKDWQEKIVVVENEKNIADLQNEQGFVVEFQHSHIKPEEQRAREHCYKEMVWVVDGLRLKNDFSRFSKNITQNTKLFMKGFPLYVLDFIDEVFSKSWVHSSVPVLFDFTGNNNEQPLYCLLPENINKKSYSSFVFPVSKNDFVSMITTNQWSTFYSQLIDGIATIQKELDRINVQHF